MLANVECGLIESDWNLKTGKGIKRRMPIWRINRIRLEFKVDDGEGYDTTTASGLIESDWNLKNNKMKHATEVPGMD